MALAGNVLAGALEKLKGGSKAVKEDDGLQPLELASQELIDAVKAGDTAGVADAIRGVVEICMNDNYKE